MADETMFQKAEDWAFGIALKKVIVAVAAFLASSKFALVIAWLEAHGIALNINPQKFQVAFTALGVAGFAAAHDYLRLKFPNNKFI